MIIKDPTPMSSFLSVEKDMNLIVDIMFKNNRLKKLLYYTSKDALERGNLSEEESIDLFGKHIRLIPKLPIEEDVKNYIMLSFDNFTPNMTNPEFRDNILEFDIVCHFDQWNLKDFQLRPYKIAAEIDSMFNNKRLTGIGTVQFLGANQLILSDEYAGLAVLYQVIHGDEDKTPLPNPVDQAQFEQDFKELFGY